MSNLAYVAFDRVTALGAISANLDATDPAYTRAQTLISMAIEQTLTYIGKTDADYAALDLTLQGVIATVVADMAATPISHNQTKLTGAYEMDEPLASPLMSDAHRDILNRAFPSLGLGTTSFVVTRDQTSTYIPNGFLDDFTVWS